ncbi:MAG: DUF3078 domain-containing protein [Spirosomaceae bacterium]|nr:DUF3078 domain-containing protein [Spirosomataceae bacterium]
MKKQLFVYIITLLAVLQAYAQDAAAPKDTSYWKKASQFGVNLNQGAFSSNFVGGGVNSIALGVILNSKAEYKKAKDTWTNDFQFQYGTIWTNVNDWRKNADRLFFDSKYGRALNSKWNFYANLNFLSQIAQGFKYEKAADGREKVTKLSNFFAPAYLTQAIGFEYKPVSYFSIQIAPLSMRQVIVADDNLFRSVPNNYGVSVENGKNKGIRNEVGLVQVVADYNRDLAKDVNLKWRYQAFAPYGENFGTLDNRLDAQLTAKFAKYFNFNFGISAIRFNAQADNKLQFAQTMGVGFLYAW